MIKMIGFDLDGTICDSLPLCIQAFKNAVEPYVGHNLTEEEIAKTFGLNEAGMIKKFVKNDWGNALNDFYINYEALHGICDKPFTGIKELISFLKQNHIIVPLITGKGQKSCMYTLQKLGLDNAFDDICCGNEKCPHKGEDILYLLEKYDVEKDEFFYIGDAVSDIEICSRIGVKCLSASWNGYHNSKELKEKNPLYTFEEIQELKNFLHCNM